jgi:hypothetical protein
VCTRFTLPGFYAIDIGILDDLVGAGDTPGEPGMDEPRVPMRRNRVWGAEGFADLQEIFSDYVVSASDLQVMIQHDGAPLEWSPFRVVNALPFALRRSKVLSIASLTARDAQTVGKFVYKKVTSGRFRQLSANYLISVLQHLIQFETSSVRLLTVCVRPYRFPPGRSTLRSAKRRSTQAGNGRMTVRLVEDEAEHSQGMLDPNAAAEGDTSLPPDINFGTDYVLPDNNALVSFLGINAIRVILYSL